MSRDKSVWFAEEILLDAKLINCQLESGEWDAVQDMLRAEAQLSRDAETGRLRPKKASEYTLRLIAEVLHIMRLDVEQGSYNRSTLAVAEQCLRLVRSCAAAGTKMQTYISKDMSILDSMLALAVEYRQPSAPRGDELAREYERCMAVLVQALGNLVVNNPFNQIIVWDKFEAVVLDALVGGHEALASAAAMVVYNILLGQPHVLPDDALLLNSLAYMYGGGNTEYPHLIIEYLVGVENTYLERLYARLEPEARLLVLGLAHNMLAAGDAQDINVSVSFVRFMALEFKSKSDRILKTVDKYVAGVEPREVALLLDVLGAASAARAYLRALQADLSLLIDCAFLLRAIHKLGKESNNFFTSLNKLYEQAGCGLVPDPAAPAAPAASTAAASDHLAPDATLGHKSETEHAPAADTASECTESESSEQFYECADVCACADATAAAAAAPAPAAAALAPLIAPLAAPLVAPPVKSDHDLVKVAFVKSMTQSDESRLPPSRKISLEHKIDIEDGEPPLILDPAPLDLPPVAEVPRGLPPVAEVPCGLPPVAEMPCGLPPVAEVPHDLPRVAEVPRGLPPLAEVPHDLPAVAEALRDSPVAEAPPPSSQDESPEEPLTEIQLTAEPTHTSPPPETREVKKSQNLSTDFNLSEQLERILGVSAEKARGEARVKIAEPAPPPSVKIHSPDGHRPRVGNAEPSAPRSVVTEVHSVEQHVAFGFKAALVRVLANLCWQHPDNKRHMRELEVIPVLLDCCNIDARNPLIMQWVIFAMRNLCENCPENQELISQLTLRAPLQGELLQEMGLALHTDAEGRTLRLAPLHT